MSLPELTPEQEAEQAASRARLAAQVEEFAKKHPQGFDAALEAAVMERTIKERTDLAAATDPGEVVKRDGTCAGCGKAFQQSVILMNGRPLLAQQYCQPCVDAHNERQAGDEDSKGKTLAERWEDICPPDYRDTDPLRIISLGIQKLYTLQTTPPRPIRVEEIWKKDPKLKGIGLVGKTGECKTRIMLELLRRFHFAGHQVRYINAVNFADELAAAYGGKADSAEQWMKKIERVEILFIDDLGKEKLTERVEATYYRIVEFRKAHKLPLYFTGNMIGQDLIEKWERNAEQQGFFSDRAEPIVRRLREMTDPITIKNR